VGKIAKIEKCRIVDLRPASDSSSDVAKALHRAEDERARAAALHDEIKSQRGAVLTRGTAEEIEAQGRALHDLAGYLEDLDTFMAELAPELPKAREREREAHIRGKIAELDREGKVARFAARFKEVYPVAAQAIVEVLMLEVEAEAATKQERVYLAQLKKPGEEPPNVASPFHAITGGGLCQYTSFGAMIRLPGVLGAPAIPVDVEPRYKTVFVERPDWDRINLGRTRTGNPIATKIVEERVIESHVRLTRDDTPFWWPKE
jgi:hypothetical protein